MTIRWIGQSGYLIRTENAEILLDPYLSDAVNRVANRPRLVDAPLSPSEISADAVICTHDHLDHLDVDAAAEMSRNTRFITTGEGRKTLMDMGFSHVDVLTEGDLVTIGDLKLTAVYAKHTVEAFGVILQVEGKTLYFSGDTLFDERLYQIREFHPDVTFLCINGKLGNMNVDEAVAVAQGIGAPRNIPNHYGMFASNTEDPRRFTDRVSGGFIMEFNREYDVSEICG
ncbi:MAG: MBL fold metallo-hydrolase [Clostridia bacterium]|nr:MBL fold metallo-hydrolase [Clostridia bacterium]